jgi:PAS domain S-box-containing protein
MTNKDYSMDQKISDIERKILTDKKQEYLSVLDELPSMIWRTGQNGWCDFLNRAWLDFTGRPLEDELGEGWLQGVHPEDQERCRRTITNAVSKREPFEMEYRLLHHSGEYRWILDIGRPYQDKKGRYAGFVGSCVDLSERKLMDKQLFETNAALRASEARFKDLFEHAPDAVLALDAQGTILLANERAQGMFACPPAAMIGKPVNQFLPGFDLLFQHWSNSPAAKKPARKKKDNSSINTVKSFPPSLYPDQTGRRTDGAEFPVEVSLGRLDSDDTWSALITIRDASQRKQAEEVLREREKLLITAATSAPIIFFRINLDGVIQYTLGPKLNRSATGEILSGLSVYDLYKDTPVIECFERARSGETLTVMIDLDNRSFEITYAPLLNERSEISSVVGVAVDITRYRKTEQALKESEGHFRTIFKDAILGIKLIDLQGRIVETNPALEEMLGYTGDEMRHMSFIDLTHPEDTPLMARFVKELTAGRTDYFRMEKRYLHKSGQVIWGRLAMSLFRNEAGEPQYGIGMVENISAQKQAEAEVAELRRRLVDSSETERLQMAQDLHDGPLQDLQAMAYQIAALGEVVTDEQGQQDLNALSEEIHRVAQSLRSMCGELRPPALAPFGLEKAIRSHAESMHEKNPDLSIHLNLMIDGKQLPERVRLALFRIYQHSMANIIRHAHAKNVWVTFLFNNDQIVLEIVDNGTGFKIPKRWIELARQGHFGLVGSIERAESIGGRIEIESQPGSGTTLRVIVPRREEEQVMVKERL